MGGTDGWRRAVLDTATPRRLGRLRALLVVACLMLFNSPEFIFLFLPCAVVLHFVLARWSAEAAIVGTTVSSLVFYAWWNPPFVVLPIASILANFWLARRIVMAPTLPLRASASNVTRQHPAVLNAPAERANDAVQQAVSRAAFQGFSPHGA